MDGEKLKGMENNAVSTQVSSFSAQAIRQQWVLQQALGVHNPADEAARSPSCRAACAELQE